MGAKNSTTRGSSAGAARKSDKSAAATTPDPTTNPEDTATTTDQPKTPKILFMRDPNEAANQKFLGTTDKIYRYVEDDKLYKYSSIIKAGYDDSVISDEVAPKLPEWIEFSDVPRGSLARKLSLDPNEQEKITREPLFFRDPNEKANQRLIKTTENIYRYVKNDKLYKRSSILKAGYDATSISEEVAPPLPQWIEFRTVPMPNENKKVAEAKKEKTPLFFRDPNERANQRFLSTCEKLYRYIENDKVYKHSSILKAGYDESDISEELAPKPCQWVEFLDAPRGSTSGIVA